MLLNLISWLVIGFSIFSALRGNKAREVLSRARIVYFQSGIVPWLLAPLLLVATISVMAGLQGIAPHFMQVGWVALLSHDSQSANVGFSVLGGIRSANGLLMQALGLGVVFALLVLLPTYAEWEEQSFRRHITDLKPIAIKSLTFGLMHMIMGVSLCVALALAGSGLAYAIFYNQQCRIKPGQSLWLREALAFRRVTALHAIYNALLVSLLGLLILFA